MNVLSSVTFLDEATRRERIVDAGHGPEFTSRAVEQWAYENGVEWHFIEPGKPTENAYIESFNGKFRDECLNENWFTTLADARQKIEHWRQDYNQARPHSALGYRTPNEFCIEAAALASPPLATPVPASVMLSNPPGLSLRLVQKRGAGHQSHRNCAIRCLTFRFGGAPRSGPSSTTGY